MLETWAVKSLGFEFATHTEVPSCLIHILIRDDLFNLIYNLVQFSCSVVSNSLWPHESQHARPPSPSPTPGVHSDSRPSSPWCHPAIASSVAPSPPAPNPSQHQSLFQWATLRMRWPKYWSFSFSIIPSKEIPGLISFRMERLDLLVVQGTLTSLLQHHSSIASSLRLSAFFTVQLSSIHDHRKYHSLD